MLDIIWRIRRSSIVPVDVSLCFLTVPWNFPGDDPVGCMFRYSFAESLFLIFLTALCIFISIVFIGSFWNLQNYLVLTIFIHFSVHFRLSMKTIPLPLSWRSTIIHRFLDNLFITSLSLNGILIVLYFSQALLNFVLRFDISVSGKLVSLCIILWQKFQIQYI